MSKADEINPKQVEFLISEGATVAQAAEHLGISKKTIERHFAEPVTRGRELLAMMRAATAERLASHLATEKEIAYALNISVDTLMTHFSDAIKRGRCCGACDIRAAQMRSAKSGNVAMLIWLGKQYLGQSNNPSPAYPPDKMEDYFMQQESELQKQQAAKQDELREIYAELEESHRSWIQAKKSSLSTNEKRA